MSALMRVGAAGTEDVPVLKHVPQDFVVHESMVVDLVDEGQAEQRYFLLRKSGYTTMEAIRAVAQQFGVPSADVTYGGLKDEDGITQQVIAVPVAAAPADGWRFAEAERWIVLHPYGHGAEPLRIGGLEGNAFSIVLRNLEQDRAFALAEARKIPLFYFNYYDIQRFGVPGGPKRTHLVGAAILAGDWTTALAELIGLNAPESAAAAAWTGPAADYFTRLDWRTTSFYLAADASYQWNEKLRAMIDETAPQEAFTTTVEGLEYRYVRSTPAAVAVLGAAPTLAYARHTFRDGAHDTRMSERSTVVQTVVAADDAAPDEHFPGRYRVRIRLFLPSGAYATSALRQLLGRW